MTENGLGQQPNGDCTADTENTENDRRYVFISYASQDQRFAEAICRVLERERIGCWIAPRDVMAGEYYAGAILRALNQARVLLLILTQHANESPHVLREVERCSSKRCPIIALRIGTVALSPSLEYFLSASHWLEANLSDIEVVLPKLLPAVRRTLGFATEGSTSAQTRPPHSAQQPLRAKLGRLITGFAAVTLILIAVAGHWPELASWHQPVSARPTVSTQSVAVLPFADMSEKRDQEYFSDGLSEELIDRLAQAKTLKVIARTSSFQFKGKSEDIRTIGQQLGVANLLEGSVRTSGSAIRVSAQLISVVDGTHLWSQIYERKAGDVFKIQDDIAAAVVAALKVTIAPPARAHDAEPNLEAYNKILLARYFNYRNTLQDSDHAMAAINEALQIQPDNAKAWVVFADIYFVRAVDRWMPSRDAYPAARKAIDRALEIDPKLANAHAMLAALEKVFNNDTNVYQREMQIALALDPSIANPLDEAIDLYQEGNVDAAIPLFRRAADRDPLDTWTLAWMANGLYAVNDLTEAEKTFDRIVTLQPDIAGTYCPLGRVLLADHKLEEALAAMTKEPDEANRLTCMPAALWALGRRKESDAMLAQAEKNYRGLTAYELAYCYAFRGQKDEAFQWLNRAYGNKDLRLQFLKEDPDFRSLHTDPRFAALEQKLKN